MDDPKPETETPKPTENADEKSSDKAPEKTEEKPAPKAPDTSEKEEKVTTGPGTSTKDDEKKDRTTEPSHSSLLDCGAKPYDEQFAELRMTAKTLSYLIDNRDREKVHKWIVKLDSMKDKEEERLERLQYARYLVSTLTGSFGLVSPFMSAPPNVVKPLSEILAPAVFADLMKDTEADIAKAWCLEKQSGNKRPPKQHHPDSQFFRQQLYPPEGLMCYSAAFST